MIADAKCKFCGCALRLEIDDDYAKTNDFFKLLPLAACNRCADLRQWRSRLHHRIESLCGQILAARNDKEAMAHIRCLLEAVTKKYLLLVGEWMGKKNLVWEEAMVDPFIEKPQACGKHLGLFWKMAAQQELI